MVEYEALVLGLKATINIGIKKLHAYGDLQFVINQENEIYNTKDFKLQPCKDLVTRMVERCFR